MWWDSPDHQDMSIERPSHEGVLSGLFQLLEAVCCLIFVLVGLGVDKVVIGTHKPHPGSVRDDLIVHSLGKFCSASSMESRLDRRDWVFYNLVESRTFLLRGVMEESLILIVFWWWRCQHWNGCRINRFLFGVVGGMKDDIGRRLNILTQFLGNSAESAPTSARVPVFKAVCTGLALLSWSRRL